MFRNSADEYKRLTIPIYDLPSSVQRTIPIYRISEDGIFQLEKQRGKENVQFDKAYLFADSNYSLKGESERELFLKRYCQLLNSMHLSFKIVIMNNNRDMQRLRNEVFLRCEDEGRQRLAKEFNCLMEDAIVNGKKGISQARLFIITCEAQTADDARNYFQTIEGNIKLNFRKLESEIIPLNAKERLRYLHHFYCLGKEESFTFDFQDSIKRGADWRNSICSLSIRHHKDDSGKYDGQTLEYDQRYVRTLFVREYPSSIDDEFLKMLTSVSYHTIITLDVAPIPDAVSKRKLLDKYLQVGVSIDNVKERQIKAGAYAAEIPYTLAKQREEIKANIDLMDENDERIFYLGLYITITASSMAELEERVLDLNTRARNYSFELEPAMWRQMEALHTVLPLGTRFCNHMRPIFTQPLCAFVPFCVSELNDRGGLYYGVNEISHNIVIGDRKRLQNPHGFVLGASGAGKGYEVKSEMSQVVLKGADDVIVIDPQNEYAPLAEALGGQYIDVSPLSGDHINPLDVDTLENYRNREAFVADKSELLLAIAEQILEDGIEIGQKSIVARCVRIVYDDYFSKKDALPPTMDDFYRVLNTQQEKEARDLRLAFELFIDGPLNFLTKQSNVNTKSSFLIYGTNNVGKNQEAVAETVMLESIRSRVASNFKKGIATWIYIDELHNFTGSAAPLRYLEKIWKEFRKLGGINTGITQNIMDLLRTKEVRTMLNNSKFFILLNMGEDEANLLGETMGMNDELIELIRGAEPGHGVMKFGDKTYIPKVHELPEESLLYSLFNTNFHEKQEWKRRRLKRELRQLPQKAQAAIRESDA